MSNRSKKAAREAAIKSEIARREADRASRSPINRQQMLLLVSNVGAKIADNGHKSDFTLTDSWLNKHNIDIDKMHEFFESVNILDDWSLLIEGDPFQLFGASENRCSWMPLEENELSLLIDYVDRQVQENGCHHDHRHTKEWLSDSGHNVNEVLAALMAHGGFCDCEVVMNVEEDSIYPQ
ncbi:MAG: DUF2695 domain-containing protein [Candidatus Thiodiazotropha lotti]|nr:DUF2695 domain-containing protein [Candidatus Thiodiazotropha lotti]MCW4217944.1 DUF2695 domain-containing protein [Candidatus Thiodiazotropha lotti]